MKKNVFILLAFITLISCEKKTKSPSEGLSLIPLPVHVERQKGYYTLDSTTIIIYKDSLQLKTARYLQMRLQQEKELRLKIVKYSMNERKDTIIQFDIDSAQPHKEGYYMSVNQEGIKIEGKDEAGLFYGVQTLLQLIPTRSEERPRKYHSFLVPHVLIRDYPRFGWRGMLLDVCRHFVTPDSIKRFIDILAIHKLNVFHWHLTDDQGWRIEIKRYPKLTEIGAWRVNRENQSWDKWDPVRKGEDPTYGGFYSQSEIQEIVQYAKDRQITVVPEIEMPAHAMAALAAYPELSCTGEKISVVPGGIWPITHIFCAGNEKTFEMIENVLSEVMNLFPSKYIHIGGDEATKTNWEKCNKCKARMKTEKLQNIQELQSYFIKRIEKFLVGHNRRLIGWDEILEGGLAPEATVMSWRGISGGIDAARQGHNVVMTPTDYMYFDYYQAKSGEPLAIGGLLPIEKVYSYEPVPADLDTLYQKFILGAQANVWTEYIHDFRHVEYMMLPRMCALAEVDWSPRELRNYEDFMVRMHEHYNRLDLCHINYRQPDITGLKRKTVFMDKAIIRLISPRPEWTLHYTVDGSEPSISSPVFPKFLKIKENMILSVLAYNANERAGRMIRGELIKESPLQGIALKNPHKGLNYKCFRGNFSNLNQLDSANAAYSGISDSICIPDSANKIVNAIMLYGYINIPSSGLFTFQIAGKSFSFLFIHNQLLVDHGFQASDKESGEIVLKAGYHPFKLVYFKSDDGNIPSILIEGRRIFTHMIDASMLARDE